MQNMPEVIRVAIIGLDTSHSVEYARRIQSPDWPEELLIRGLRVVSCLRFPSPFQSDAGQSEREAQLSSWGVRVADDVADALQDSQAVMLEINDPSLHLPWFLRVVSMGQPVFIDKPLADNVRSGKEIIRLAKLHGIRLASSSPVRSDAGLVHACAAIPRPTQAAVYGVLGTAAVGSSVVWYGVHAVEMLNRAMGTGAVAVTARRDGSGVTLVVDYVDNRRGVVELTEGSSVYGGVLRDSGNISSFHVNNSNIYTAQLGEIERFFRGGEPPATLVDSLDVLAILDATERSLQSARTEPVQY